MLPSVISAVTILLSRLDNVNRAFSHASPVPTRPRYRPGGSSSLKDAIGIPQAPVEEEGHEVT